MFVLFSSVNREARYNELKMESGKWKIVLNIFDVVFALSCNVEQAL